MEGTKRMRERLKEREGGRKGIERDLLGRAAGMQRLHMHFSGWNEG